ncbi:hypothetical protein DRN67_00800 [Candidatus Micrarchaeota archaeon]|nr:MAG: hypothetical protein DRN67_00800 [Candidatus Micrarchaeota archaeon]
MAEKRIISILSGKGGVGKTTLSVNLGAIAASNGKEMVLVDGDLGNPSVGLHLGLWGYTAGLQSVLAAKCGLEQVTIVHPATGMRVVPSTLEYSSNVKMSKLKDVLKAATYRSFIIDSPPGIASGVEEILSSCNETIVVVTPDIPSVMSAVKIIEIARKKGVKVDGLVLNRVQNKRYEMHEKEIESTCNVPILVSIKEDRAVPESISAKMPAVLYAPKSKASRSFQQLATELGFSGKAAGVKGRGGMMARFFAWLSRLFGGE